MNPDPRNHHRPEAVRSGLSMLADGGKSAPAAGRWPDQAPAGGGRSRPPRLAVAVGLLCALAGALATLALADDLRLRGWFDPAGWWVESLGIGCSLLLAALLVRLVAARERTAWLAAAEAAALRDSEARFRRLVEQAPFGLLFYRRTGDDQLLLDDLNPAAEAILDVPLTPLRGLPIEVVFPALGGTDFPEIFRQVARFGSRHQCEVMNYRDPLRGINGSFEVVAFQTAPDQVAVAFSDVTAREAASAELRHRDHLLQATAEAMGQLLCGRLAESVGVALGTLGVAVGADRAYVFETHSDPITGMPLMSQRYEWCAEDAVAQIDNPDLQNLPYFPDIRRWYLTLSAGGAINGLVRDFPASERLGLEAQDIRSLLALPIRIEERFWGFVGFDDCHQDRVWTQSEVFTLRTAAAALGHALVRLRAESALRDSEARLRDVANNIPGLVFQFYVRADGRRGFYYISERAPQWLGIRLRPTLGLRRFVTHLEPADRAAFLASIEAAIASGSPWHFEGCFLRPGAERLWFKALADPRCNGGELVYTGVLLDISERKRSEQMIEHLAYYDPLTGLPNRALLEERAGLALALAARRQGEAALLIVDLDRFKEINESLGHGTGDALLVQVARRLREQARAEDTVCRLAGDAFVLLLPDAGQQQVLELADKLTAIFRAPFDLAGHALITTACQGIALYPNDGHEFGDLLKNADTALHRAKQEGRGTRLFYDRDMHVATLEWLVLESDLRRAMVSGQLQAWFEPKVRLADGGLVGAEALVRWQHPSRGLLAPGAFIPLAEGSDLVVELGDWMLRAVCRQLAAWRRRGWGPLQVSVNLAPRHFHRPHLTDRIRALLAAYDLPAGMLELELTESMLLETSVTSRSILDELQVLGVGLALDDFGTGYSSLGYLKRLPLTTLKIDRSFVADLETDPDDRAIAATILALGRQMDLAVVAEGVETEAQRRYLLEQGCEVAQGYLFSRPLPADEFAARWLASH